MTHLDDDTLALLALGEPAGDADEEHLRGCRRCADELASLAATARIGRQSMLVDHLAHPEPRVWDAIATELGQSDRGGASGSGGRSVAEPPRRRRTAWIAAAAAAAVVIGAAIAVGMLLLAPREAVEATADLEPFPAWSSASGSATLHRAADGTRTLDVRLEASGVPAGDATELWLIDPDTAELVSLGPIDGTGSFALPSSVDPTRFSVVDISAEPDDGDPAHSGDSIVRGTLQRGASE